MPNDSNNGRLAPILISVLAIFFFSCSKKTVSTGPVGSEAVTHAPDYSELKYWAAHPDKKDYSDSIPVPLKTIPVDTSADVFFLHPTSFTGKNKSHYYNASIDDSIINNKTDHSSILYQASIFNGSCRIYAPRYRQAWLQMYFEKDSLLTRSAFDTAYEDVKSAFQYYLDHYNNGRPIIIASHSQGTTHAKRLMKEFFDNKPLQAQLVCAYLVGMAVEKNYFTSIPACADSLSNGCVVSWRTYRKGHLTDGISTDDSSLIVVNPVTWTMDPSPAPPEFHKGAVLYSFNTIAPSPHSTEIAGNVLWISKPKFPGGAFYFKKNYHIGDFNLFYMNVREDVSRRIRGFSDKKNQQTQINVKSAR